jgi:hypothetical protein
MGYTSDYGRPEDRVKTKIALRAPLFNVLTEPLVPNVPDVPIVADVVKDRLVITSKPAGLPA